VAGREQSRSAWTIWRRAIFYLQDRTRRSRCRQAWANRRRDEEAGPGPGLYRLGIGGGLAARTSDRRRNHEGRQGYCRFRASLVAARDTRLVDAAAAVPPLLAVHP